MSKAWPLVKLGEVINRVERFESRDELTEYPFAGTYSFARGIFVSERKIGSSFALPKIQRIHEGDFVYCKIMAWEGAFGLVKKEANGCVMSGAFVVYEPNLNLINPLFLDYFFKIPNNWKTIGKQSTGTNVRRQSLHPHQFEGSTIPLPPLAEQQRIVAKIERLAGKVQEAITLRSQAKKEAESVISSARNGLFSTLSQKIEPKPLDSVSESRLGKMLSQNQAQNEDGVPYIRNANIQWGYLDLSSVYRMHITDEEKEKFSLQAGDILICEGGDIGKAAIWNNEITGCIYQKALHRLRVNPKLIKPKFMLNHLFWAAEQGHFADLKTQTTIAHLTGVKLKTYPVFIPTIEEQCRVITILEDLKNKIDESIAIQARAAAELDAMLPSILDQAFKGEL